MKNKKIIQSIIIFTAIFFAQNTNAQVECLKLTSDLANGMSGPNVSALQRFLKQQGHFPTTQEITTFYGNITQQSVAKFQQAQDIVLNGTPETTGLGRVGPTTRNVIEKISCANNTSSASKDFNNFFGYNLDEIFENSMREVNYNSVDLYKDIDLYKSIDLYSSKDLFTNVDIYQNIDVFRNIDIYRNTNNAFNLIDVYRPGNVNLNTGFEDGVSALIYAKAVNGEFLRGGSRMPVAVANRNVELQWETTNTKNCVLSGDLREKRLLVPTSGSAKLALTTTNSGGRASNGDPLYSFRISCEADTLKPNTLPTSDTIILWVYRPAPATTTPATQ
jgi:peptidoglycan hydrolase-like protein with peptidoglycan-binding domain